MLYLVDHNRHLDGTILIVVLFILVHDCFGTYPSFSLKENGILVTSKSVFSEFYPVYNIGNEEKMATFGKLSESDASKEDWNSYTGQLNFYFVANGITDADRKRAMLLSSCGASCYKLFRGLTQPEKPENKTYEDLVKLMEKHQRPTPNPIAERFKFNSRNRQPGESISTYMSVLRQLTEYCE